MVRKEPNMREKSATIMIVQHILEGANEIIGKVVIEYRFSLNGRDVLSLEVFAMNQYV